MVTVPKGSEALVYQSQTEREQSTPSDHLTLVCVDDDPENLSALRALLEKWGCTVETFTSSATALQYASTHQAPDGVLLDYQLGDDEHDGLTLINSLREHWGEQLKGALVTAMRDDQVRQQARQQQLLFIAKPVKPAQLKALLRHLQKLAV